MEESTVTIEYYETYAAGCALSAMHSCRARNRIYARILIIILAFTLAKWWSKPMIRVSYENSKFEFVGS